MYEKKPLQFTSSLFVSLTLHENLSLNQIPWHCAESQAHRECQSSGHLTRKQGDALPLCFSLLSHSV